MESIEKIPVSSGVSTGCLSMIAGAGASTGMYPDASMSPSPSTGEPSESTTLPRNPSPTGVPAVLPVLFTLEPCVTLSSSLKRTQPIESLRMSCTMPLTPSAKRRISPKVACPRPPTVAIPSPTVRTSPTCSAMASGVHAEMLSLRSGMILPLFVGTLTSVSLSWRNLPPTDQS